MFSFFVYAQSENIEALCPIKRFIEKSSPSDFSECFKGDTIFFSVPNADNVLLESFRLLSPDTIWIKDRPKNNLPQEHKHFKLINNFAAVPGWGVNAHRQYTPGNVIERNQFIICGHHTESIPYKGTSHFILLQDVASGQMLKWDFTNYENKGLVIFSPSINRHLSLMKDLDFIMEQEDSTFLDAKCSDVIFSIGVKPNIWNISLDVDFKTAKGNQSSHNWTPRFFLKKDEPKINQ